MVDFKEIEVFTNSTHSKQRDFVSIKNFIKRENQVWSENPDEIDGDSQHNGSDYAKSIESLKKNIEGEEWCSHDSEVDENERRAKNESDLARNARERNERWQEECRRMFGEPVAQQRLNLPCRVIFCLVGLGCH